MRLSPTEFAQLGAWIHRLCGLAIAPAKAYLIEHRLEPVAIAAGCADFTSFLAKLQGPEGAPWRDAVVEAITTSETSFFRDAHPFEAMRHYVLPALAAQSRRRKSTGGLGTVRIWCAGVATGQEVYSLAMVLDEAISAGMDKGIAWNDLTILATDISSRVLDQARAGLYRGGEIERGLSPARRHRYFIQKDAGWEVAPELRRRIDFRRVNLIEPLAGLGVFDLILCRNVLIYFDDDTRGRLCEQFTAMLAPAGFLLLGTMENLLGLKVSLRAEQVGETTLYRKDS